MLLHEKMNAVMKHSAQKGEKRRALDKALHDGQRVDVERGDIAAMLISAFLVILPAVAFAVLLLVAIGYFFLIH